MTKEEIALIFEGEEVDYKGYERKKIDPRQKEVTWNSTSWPVTGPTKIDGFRIYDVYGNIKYEETLEGHPLKEPLLNKVKRIILDGEKPTGWINLTPKNKFTVHLEEVNNDQP